MILADADTGDANAGTDIPVAGNDGGLPADGGADSDYGGGLSGPEAGDDAGTEVEPDASNDLELDAAPVDAPILLDTSGRNCVQEIQSNGYAFGSVAPCSQCKDTNDVSLALDCTGMIDCLASNWPCTGNCWTECHNLVAGGQPVADCVTALTNAACP
jgi:hypothetical protein